MGKKKIAVAKNKNINYLVLLSPLNARQYQTITGFPSISENHPKVSDELQSSF
jgi:hypothetical protein